MWLGLENKFFFTFLCIGIASYVREIGEKPTLVDCWALCHNCYRINKFNPSNEYVNFLCIILKNNLRLLPCTLCFQNGRIIFFEVETELLCVISMGFVFLQRVKIGTNYSYTKLWEQRKLQTKILFYVINIFKQVR